MQTLQSLREGMGNKVAVFGQRLGDARGKRQNSALVLCLGLVDVMRAYTNGKVVFKIGRRRSIFKEKLHKANKEVVKL